MTNTPTANFTDVKTDGPVTCPHCDFEHVVGYQLFKFDYDSQDWAGWKCDSCGERFNAEASITIKTPPPIKSIKL